MKRFKKVVSVTLSSMLLLSFGMTTNASASAGERTDQAIQAVSNVQLTTDKGSVIEQLTRADKLPVSQIRCIPLQKISTYKHLRNLI